MLSDNVHISCVQYISIGAQTLIGSNVYIGDHSHGTLSINKMDLSIPPYQRVLGDVRPINIGKNVWIGNGAVILAGTNICDGCVVGANAVVKGEFKYPCIIAGVPAKNVKNLMK
ncbi:acyltransferase [Xenorhabdus bovienii]|nr:acyltransferase [Xenorhabdus bovienii]MDE9469871.1 acyltransferase [Xenorhabdus bovienii]MDE9534053.1 acyltransferase [Xenorhabdus bovienii]MDE9586982.1 acyltransferase [Xenorhabdus bovienii]